MVVQNNEPWYFYTPKRTTSSIALFSN